MERKELIKLISSIAKGDDSEVLKLLNYIESIGTISGEKYDEEERILKLLVKNKSLSEKNKIEKAAEEICNYNKINLEQLHGSYNKSEKHTAQTMLFYWAHTNKVDDNKIAKYLKRNRSSKYQHIKKFRYLNTFEKEFISAI